VVAAEVISPWEMRVENTNISGRPIYAAAQLIERLRGLRIA
jgi:hypothetical protein